MKKHIVHLLVSLFIAAFLDPIYKIFENNYISLHGYDLDKVHNIHLLYSTTATLTIYILIGLFIKIYQMISNYFENKCD